MDQEEHSFSPQEALRSLTVPGTEALCCLLQHLSLFLVTLHLQLEIKNLKQSLVSPLLKLSHSVSEPVYLAVKDNGVVAPKLSLEC